MPINPIMLLLSGLGGAASGAADGLHDDREQAARDEELRAREAERKRQARSASIGDAMNLLAYDRDLNTNYTPAPAPTPTPTVQPAAPQEPTDNQRAAQSNVQQTFAKTTPTDVDGNQPSTPSPSPNVPIARTVMLPDPTTGQPREYTPRKQGTPEELNEEALVAAGVPRPLAHAAARNPAAYAELLRSKAPQAPKLVNWETKETADGSLVQVNPETGETRGVLTHGQPLKGYHAPTEEQLEPVETTNADGTKSVVYMTRAQALGKNVPRTDPNAAKPNDNEKMAAGFATRMVTDGQQITALEQNQDFRKTLTGTFGAPGGSGSLPFVGNRTLDATAQQYKQLAENWVRANLRKESGAAIGKDEMTSEMKNYFPQPGDSDALIDQKAYARSVVEQNMIRNAGNAWVAPTASQPPGQPSLTPAADWLAKRRAGGTP